MDPRIVPSSYQENSEECAGSSWVIPSVLKTPAATSGVGGGGANATMTSSSGGGEYFTSEGILFSGSGSNSQYLLSPGLGSGMGGLTPYYGGSTSNTILPSTTKTQYNNQGIGIDGGGSNLSGYDKNNSVGGDTKNKKTTTFASTTLGGMNGSKIGYALIDAHTRESSVDSTQSQHSSNESIQGGIGGMVGRTGELPLTTLAQVSPSGYTPRTPLTKRMVDECFEAYRRGLESNYWGIAPSNPTNAISSSSSTTATTTGSMTHHEYMPTTAGSNSGLKSTLPVHPNHPSSTSSTRMGATGGPVYLNEHQKFTGGRHRDGKGIGEGKGGGGGGESNTTRSSGNVLEIGDKDAEFELDLGASTLLKRRKAKSVDVPVG